jgi:DNA repair protein RecN (Recombination protein N)
LLRRLRIENLVLIGEAELELAPGLNALTGETGAGKTIFAQAIGLLLGAKGDTGLVGAAADEAYVEAELDVPEGFFDEDGLDGLRELRPEDEPGLVLARRVFADGRTRAYAWGRAVPREDVAEAAERLIAMSGQFEQRRLGRPSYQLDALDAFCGPDQASRRRAVAGAWRELQAAQRHHDDVAQDAAAALARVDELRALVADTEGMDEGAEVRLRAKRETLRHVVEIARAVGVATEALSPDEGEGAVSLAGAAERALEPLATLVPDLGRVVDELRDTVIRLREIASDVHAYGASLDDDPLRLDGVEAELDRIADARRRFRCDTYEDLLARRDEAERELAALEGGDPVSAASLQLEAARARFEALATELGEVRRVEARRFAEAVAAALGGVGMGEGEFRVDVTARQPGPTGADEVAFAIRPNAGLPFAPVAETASGGELSRVALALAAVAGGETLVFDEIDAGIGGTTAHAVASTLRRLAERAQVVTITHLPQIASVADRHFCVEKTAGDPTRTTIARLDDAERRGELERMLGGEAFISSVAARE